MTPSPTLVAVPNPPRELPTPSPSAPTPAAPSLVDDAGTFGPSGLWATRGSQLYLSTDYGATWVQRHMVPGVALDAEQGDVLSNLFVLDANHAWTATPDPAQRPTAARAACTTISTWSSAARPTGAARGGR